MFNAFFDHVCIWIIYALPTDKYLCSCFCSLIKLVIVLTCDIFFGTSEPVDILFNSSHDLKIQG